MSEIWCVLSKAILRAEFNMKLCFKISYRYLSTDILSLLCIKNMPMQSTFSYPKKFEYSNPL